MVITSRNNPFIKRILSLREKKYRREYGEYIIEGVKQIREAVNGGCEFVSILCSENYKGEHFLLEKEQLVSESVFEKLSEESSPQGILAVLKMPDCSIKAPSGNALLLDTLSDPGNLGTIIRTANAAGYTDIYLRNCTDPFSSKSVRASMSGIFFVRLHSGSLDEISEVLGDIPKICADMNGENVFRFEVPQRFCLVIGNEANGVSEEVRSLCRYTVRIPMRESCESLNAGISAAVLMYQLGAEKFRKL